MPRKTGKCRLFAALPISFNEAAARCRGKLEIGIMGQVAADPLQ